ncbi:hypothetical protein FRB90_002091 [Tulasnella sp. 427]|nr:hypothetical protein FRB90_002091 [Tulasnella sp. 427]
MMKSANRVSVSYYSSSEREERQIVVETRPNVRIREMGGLAVQECPGLRVVVRLDEDGDWRSVVESLDFGSLPNNLGVWFCFDQKQGGVGSDSESQLSEWITIMGGHGAAFETVALDEAFDPIPALRYLSTPQIDESNRQYWACPLLKSVYIDNAATWSDQQDEELEQLCIAFLRRSDQAVEGLTPPKQVKDLLVERGKISATLERMGEFTGVRLSSD